MVIVASDPLICSHIVSGSWTSRGVEERFVLSTQPDCSDLQLESVGHKQKHIYCPNSVSCMSMTSHEGVDYVEECSLHVSQHWWKLR